MAIVIRGGWLLWLALVLVVASSRAQFSTTDTEVQPGVTLAIVAQAGMGDPRQELVARFGGQARLVDAVIDLLKDSGVPWEISQVAIPLGDLLVEIAVADAGITERRKDLELIAEELRILNPADPDYESLRADLEASRDRTEANLRDLQSRRVAAVAQREILQRQSDALGPSPLGEDAQLSLNDFVGQLTVRPAGVVSNRLLAELPAGPVLLVSDAVVASTNACCWGPGFQRFLRCPTATWQAADSRYITTDEGKVRTPNRDYSYTKAGGLITVRVEVTTHYYGFLLLDLRRDTGPVLTTNPLLPWGQVNQAFDLTLTTAGGARPVEFSKSDCGSAEWLAVDRDGRVHGTPTNRGPFCLVVAFRDASGATNAARLQGCILPVPTPEMRLTPMVGAPGYGVLRFDWTAGSHWQTETSTNLLDWAPSGFGPNGAPLGTNSVSDLIRADQIGTQRYFRARLLPW